jgi:hypothetical protein
MNAESTLEDLSARAWQLHRDAEAKSLTHLVRPSVPILFFGDSERYLSSEVRVLTVGLNPSHNEFPPADAFARFRGAARLQQQAKVDARSYLASLNDYFRVAPYRRWFDPAFEPMLNGIGTSYYDGHDSAALHTDLCSPLATDPTWSGLEPGEHVALERGGRQLWHDLVAALRPDLVLVSVRRSLLGAIRFPLIEDLGVVFELDGPKRARPYRLEATRRLIDGAKAAVFAFGQASQTPFGSVSGEDKRLIGGCLRGLVNA